VASIEQRGGSWRVVWRRDGVKQYTSWPSLELAAQARDIAEAHRHQITADQLYAAMGVLDVDEDTTTVPTVREWAERWLAAKTRITPGTRAGYAAQLANRIYPAIGDRRLDRVTPTEIGTLLNRLRADGLRSTSVTRYYTLLHALMRAAVHERLIDDNPVTRTDWIRDLTEHDDTGEPGQVRLTHEEYRVLLAAVDPADRPLVELLAGTGARWSEAVALSVGHIVPPTGTSRPRVRIWRAWKRDGRGGLYLGTTKGRRRREIAISDALYETLRPLVEGQPADALLFRATNGGMIHYRNWRLRHWDPAVIRAMRCPAHPPPNRGVPRAEPGRRRCRDYGGTNDHGEPCGAITAAGMTRCHAHMGPDPAAVSTCDCPGVLRRRPTPHDLRHSHAAWLFSDARVTPLAISRRLGHAQLSTTSEIYGDLMPAAEDAVITALDDAISQDD